ncbi:MAG TPA: phospholipid carrier-dependent glycosyltransferase [Chloroflexi bacterium]|nr:MAG: hypothetical protein B6243_11170 [Anaerolineaceae bacterium 4572_5.2]HEY83875.1 phospholipid carrier-dependent glycosyltransferase [Chloroflexota bacterium]
MTVYLTLLLIANFSLLIPPLQLPGAILLALVLPGWGWANRLLPKQRILPLIVLSLGLSYAITSLGALALHYLPGPLRLWHLLALLNVVSGLGFVVSGFRFQVVKPETRNLKPQTGFIAIVFLLAFLLRFTYLNYSEFQGDESLAMITAAEIIDGHDNTLFLRGKGPGEVLLPAAVWRLSSPITEGAARLPFAIAGMGGILTLYLLAEGWFSKRAALYSAAILAASGFTLGFSRIVQYQTIVLWMSALSLWAVWQWRQNKEGRWAFVSGLFLGVGLLAHYDAILVIPAIGWLFVKDEGRKMKAEGLVPKQSFGTGFSSFIPSTGSGQALHPSSFILHPSTFRFHPSSFILWLTAFLGSAFLFYLPYFLDPQIGRTGSYLEDRIGEGLLKNNLLDFLHFNSFYSSFYYVLIAGLLLAGFVGWSLWKVKWGRRWAGGAAAVIIIGLALWPDALGNWTAIPFGLVLLAVFLSPALSLPQQAALLWFAAPFMGYNFAVATPLTHIYTVLPGWALLAGWSAGEIRLNPAARLAANALLLALSTLYLWNAFARHDVEFLPSYPASNPAIFYTPFDDRPETGFFGFAHRVGWKSVGALIADGALAGDYDSNEEEDVTSWYTRHAPRACDPGSEFFYAASTVIDPVPLPKDLLATSYTAVGRIEQANGNTLTIHQRQPTTLNLETLNQVELENAFNESASPAAFSRNSQWEFSSDVNFGGKIKLAGYDLDARRAHPGGRIVLTLYWQSLVPMEESYKTFVHLDSEHKYAQADSLPVCARYPTNDWRPGQIIPDAHALHLSPDTPSGAHPLVVGLYSPEDGKRLDILDVAGNPARVSFTLTEVEVSK